MVRLYGEAPYKTVLVHGGPGAIGALKGFAKELNEQSKLGVVEAIQSKYSIAELIEELYCQICENCTEKVSLIGHSWGAWLVVLFAERYPEVVEQLILVGCAPLEDKYVSEIGERRLQNLSEEDGAIFQRLVRNEATDEDMARIPKVFLHSDNYCLVDSELHKADRTDSEMHNKVWAEAAAMRTNGQILGSFQNLKCPIYLIQGETDPHPVDGVKEPLREFGIPCETCILEKCGHSPYMEQYAKDEFYKILLEWLKENRKGKQSK